MDRKTQQLLEAAEEFLNASTPYDWMEVKTAKYLDVAIKRFRVYKTTEILKQLETDIRSDPYLQIISKESKDAILEAIKLYLKTLREETQDG